MSDRLSMTENRRMKQRIEEPPTKDLNLELTLRLGSNVLEYESSSKSENEDSILAPSPTENFNDEEEIQSKEFPCKLCGKIFSSINALNGHQNAHRHERDPPQVQNEIDMTTAFGIGTRVLPYPVIMANHIPFYGSPIYHGVHMQHVAQMSAMPWRHFVPVCGNQGLQHRSFSGPQFVMASNSLGQIRAETSMLNSMNVGSGYEFNQYPSVAVDAANRAATTRADLGGFPQNHFTRN